VNDWRHWRNVIPGEYDSLNIGENSSDFKIYVSDTGAEATPGSVIHEYHIFTTV